MRLRLVLTLATALALWAIAAIPPELAQAANAPGATATPTPTPTPIPESEETVRGAFLTTRSRTDAKGASGGRLPNDAPTKKHRAKPVPRRPKVKVLSPDTTAATAKPGEDGIPKIGAQRIAIGYTLFMANANGDPVRADPAREFHTGERVRVLVEPNVNGYLYVFTSQGDGQPEMIFPDWRLAEGRNAIEAHVPYYVPADEWWEFKENPGTERVYIVVTLDPLPAVPLGRALLPFCTENTKGEIEACRWQPTPAVWPKVQEAMKAEVQVAASSVYGQAQTENEKDATTRGLGLAPRAPVPSVIRMSATTKASVLVAVLDLIHK